MIPRMTTSGSLKGYRYNLQRSTFTLNNGGPQFSAAPGISAHQQPALPERVYRAEI